MTNSQTLCLAITTISACLAFMPVHPVSFRKESTRFLEMSTLTSPPNVELTPKATRATKEKVLVLGTGWAAVKFAQNVDTSKFDVSVVSPRNFFLFTPFLPSTVVGTVEPRSIVEPIRALLEYDSRPFTRKIKDRVAGITKEDFSRCKFLEAAAVDIDYQANKVVCKDIGEYGRDGTFDMPYDKLVIAVGATSNTFGTPGVKENAIFLKEISDSLRLRNKIADLFETAHMQDDLEKKTEMLQLCVVGGGPTGVESAVEIDDFIRDDLKNLYPKECEVAKIYLIEAADDILNTYDQKVSDFTRKLMENSQVNVLTKTFVTEVTADKVILKSFDGVVSEIKTPLVLWSTGVTATPLVKSLMDAIPEQTKRNAIETDRTMKVKGLDNVFSLGDCSTVVDSELLMDNAAALFTKGDVNKDNKLEFTEVYTLLSASTTQYPQVKLILQQMSQDPNFLTKFSEDGANSVNAQEFEKFLSTIDESLRGLPPTAQVAGQQGSYLAEYLNGETDKPFKYFHKGSMAYIGQGKAAAQVSVLANLLPFGIQNVLPPLGQDIVLTGDLAELVWKILYIDMLVSTRNKVQCLFDWAKIDVFGRDTSRF
mmetsp:Transcript_28416/g.38843  ORF Transcript_28416/g.38843 Transcript_28416/m.38843 type:complete len:595 (-) Transcript_28416:401-2185(-)|eukprot:CAMPEP_0185769024 /NCGR_PEP_ID=MMETSP1174-20130828/53319_1 /TAXON_ID=35687 /ORGANISM="Dictyocha speculum, Strain CCMP1381" /LENGTH=594 /DNA_ID=CAMNT_0028453955 /DNA_START=90 /DNA_END=1874 /DNA_ORIENTATION=-